MASHLASHGLRRPRDRAQGSEAAAATFFPGEAADILELRSTPTGGVDYAQLRRLHGFVREQDGHGQSTSDSNWSRWTFQDIAAGRVVVELLDMRERMRPCQRIRYDKLTKVCDALRSAGFRRPLLDVPLVRDGSEILAVVGRDVIEPLSNQHVLSSTLEVVVAHLVASQLAEVAQLVTQQAKRKVETSVASTGPLEVVVMRVHA